MPPVLLPLPCAQFPRAMSPGFKQYQESSRGSFSLSLFRARIKKVHAPRDFPAAPPLSPQLLMCTTARFPSTRLQRFPPTARSATGLAISPHGARPQGLPPHAARLQDLPSHAARPPPARPARPARALKFLVPGLATSAPPKRAHSIFARLLPFTSFKPFHSPHTYRPIASEPATTGTSRTSTTSNLRGR